MKKFNRSKTTKRYKFTINRDVVSKKSGSNSFTIHNSGYTQAPNGRGYTSGTTTPGTMTMTVKEAKALQKFLNDQLS